MVLPVILAVGVGTVGLSAYLAGKYTGQSEVPAGTQVANDGLIPNVTGFIDRAIDQVSYASTIKVAIWVAAIAGGYYLIKKR